MIKKEIPIGKIKSQINGIFKNVFPKDIVLSYLVDLTNLNVALCLLQEKDNVSILQVYQDSQSTEYTFSYYVIIFRIHKNQNKEN